MIWCVKIKYYRDKSLKNEETFSFIDTDDLVNFGGLITDISIRIADTLNISKKYVDKTITYQTNFTAEKLGVAFYYADKENTVVTTAESY